MLLAVLGGVALVHSPLDSALARWLWSNQHYVAAYYVNDTDAQLAMEEGNYFFAGGTYDLPRAVRSYQLALTLQPGILWGHYQLARIYFVQGKFDEAIAEANAELAANPANLRTLYVRGLIYLYRLLPGDLSLAEADFRGFVAWAPGEWGGYNDLAFTLAKEGKYNESEQVINEALAKVPDGTRVPWLWNSLGTAQVNQLQYKQAQVSFQKALSLAQGLTVKDWRRAYSGDDPAVDSQGLESFVQAIQKNLSTAQAGIAL